MKITYSNSKTQKICSEYKKAIKLLGNDVAKKLFELIDAIDSFPTLKDLQALPQYRVHVLKGNRENQYSLTIHRSYKWRLIVYPLDNDGKLLTDKSNESEMLSKAEMVEIVEISEHYE